MTLMLPRCMRKATLASIHLSIKEQALPTNGKPLLSVILQVTLQIPADPALGLHLKERCWSLWGMKWLS